MLWAGKTRARKWGGGRSNAGGCGGIEGDHWGARFCCGRAEGATGVVDVGGAWGNATLGGGGHQGQRCRRGGRKGALLWEGWGTWWEDVGVTSVMDGVGDMALLQEMSGGSLDSGGLWEGS